MKPLPQQAPAGPRCAAAIYLHVFPRHFLGRTIAPLQKERRPAAAPSGADLRSRGWGERFPAKPASF